MEWMEFACHAPCPSINFDLEHAPEPFDSRFKLEGK